MNLSWIDWSIFVGLFAGLNLMAYACRKYVKGVADFLVAGRNVGRYLGMGSDCMMGLGAVSILAMWQMNYKAGFVALWWYMLYPIAGIIAFLTGFGIYRFRQTRAMTLGQFIEMRYGKQARIFFGILCYLAGILNMGIFPIVGAGFFVYYCGFPPEFTLLGLQIPTVLPVILILVGSSVVICFMGGQVTLVVTNFMQTILVNIILIAIMVAIYRMFTWEQFAAAFQSAPNGDALLHPFRSEGASEFSKWFFFIYIFKQFYMIVSWAPNTTMVSSARSAHEGKMLRVMGEIMKLVFMGLGIGILPLAVFVLMNHPDFASQAAQINQSLANIANEQVQSQMMTPSALMYILPTGLLGAFAGVVLFAFISTHDTYLLAWGGTLIQDVIIPLRGKPLPPKQHLRLIRGSVLFVALFIVTFSMTFRQVDNIFMFFTIASSLYVAAAGVVLIGGLYWKRGSAMATWVTMIVGAILSMSGFVYRQINPDFLNGATMAFLIYLVCISVYIIVSYCGKSPDANFDEIFNRKNPDGTLKPEYLEKRKWYQWKPEIPKSDRIIISCMVIAIVLFLTGFVGIWIYNISYDVPTETWVNFWHVFIYVMFWLATAFLLWIMIAGFRDLIRLFRSLKTQKANVHDDGSVEGHHAAGVGTD